MRRGVGVGLRRKLDEKQEEDADNNGGISHVECRPMVPVEGKVQKIHHSSFQNAIGQIPEGSAQDDGKRVKFEPTLPFSPMTII